MTVTNNNSKLQASNLRTSAGILIIIQITAPFQIVLCPFHDTDQAQSRNNNKPDCREAHAAHDAENSDLFSMRITNKTRENGAASGLRCCSKI